MSTMAIRFSLKWGPKRKGALTLPPLPKCMNCTATRKTLRAVRKKNRRLASALAECKGVITDMHDDAKRRMEVDSFLLPRLQDWLRCQEDVILELFQYNRRSSRLLRNIISPDGDISLTSQVTTMEEVPSPAPQQLSLQSPGSGSEYVADDFSVLVEEEEENTIQGEENTSEKSGTGSQCDLLSKDDTPERDETVERDLPDESLPGEATPLLGSQSQPVQVTLCKECLDLSQLNEPLDCAYLAIGSAFGAATTSGLEQQTGESIACRSTSQGQTHGELEGDVAPNSALASSKATQVLEDPQEAFPSSKRIQPPRLCRQRNQVASSVESMKQNSTRKRVMTENKKDFKGLPCSAKVREGVAPRRVGHPSKKDTSRAEKGSQSRSGRKSRPPVGTKAKETTAIEAKAMTVDGKLSRTAPGPRCQPVPAVAGVSGPSQLRCRAPRSKNELTRNAVKNSSADGLVSENAEADDYEQLTPQLCDEGSTTVPLPQLLDFVLIPPTTSDGGNHQRDQPEAAPCDTLQDA